MKTSTHPCKTEPVARRVSRKTPTSKTNRSRSALTAADSKGALDVSQTPGASVLVRADVGFGNALFVRGQGQGLSWDKGVSLTCLEPGTWAWSVGPIQDQVTFKLLLNDEVWAVGDNLTINAGDRIEVCPRFE